MTFPKLSTHNYASLLTNVSCTEELTQTRSPNSLVRPKWTRTMGRYMEHALHYQEMLYSQYPQKVLTLLLIKQPHITESWLQSLPGSYTNPRPEMDDSHQQHHKEDQLHPRLLAQKPSVLPTSCRKTAYISLVRSALQYTPTSTMTLTNYKASRDEQLASSTTITKRPLSWMCHQHAERPRTAVTSK